MTIRLAGELDMSNRAELDDVLQASVESRWSDHRSTSAELTFMDSTGISAFLRAAVSCRGRGCLILHGEQPRVGRVLDLVPGRRIAPEPAPRPRCRLPSQNGPSTGTRRSRSIEKAGAQLEPDLLADAALGFDPTTSRSLRSGTDPSHPCPSSLSP